MKPASVASAPISAGSSNFGSWVKTKTTSRSPSSRPSMYRSGQSTTTSALRENRGLLMNGLRASQIVTA